MVKTAVKRIKKASLNLNGHSNGIEVPKSRLEIRKTYKLYIDGKFPRTESGRFSAYTVSDGTVNICRASRKDLRDSIVSNRKALESWSGRSAYNRGQIMYRIAETLESRKAQFIDTFIRQGLSSSKAKSETDKAIDLLVYYAGWTDKYAQVFSSVNPVESSHFNFSYPEPIGVTVLFNGGEQSGFVSLIASLSAIIAGGNTCTVIETGKYPLSVIDFAEVLHASDVPGGVVNILTGQKKELLSPAAMHMDVNALVCTEATAEERKLLQTKGAANLKRLIHIESGAIASPYQILQLQEIKTTWHPVGI